MNEIELAAASVDVAKDFLGKIVGPSLDELGGLLADKVKLFRFKNQVNILNKANEFMEKKGIQPDKISLKTLVPILEHGSLEEDKFMINKWASLLSAAADANSGIDVRPSFPEVLKQLSPREALILDKLYDMVCTIPIPRAEWAHRGGVGDNIKTIFKMKNSEFEIAIDNLYRLRVCSPPANGFAFTDKPEHKYYLKTKKIICLTEFGYSFIEACKYGND
jgi:hypothetical protein